MELKTKIKKILSLFCQACKTQLNNKITKQMKNCKQRLYLPRVGKDLHKHCIYLKSGGMFYFCIVINICIHG